MMRIGQIVYYYPDLLLELKDSNQEPGPFPAIVTQVHDDGRVDLLVFGPGIYNSQFYHAVPVVRPGIRPPGNGDEYCEAMPTE